MPTYEYRCDNCATNFDVVQSFTDDPLTECPTCGSPVRKVFGSVGIVFKGSGFYKTDSRSGGSGGSTAVPSESSTSTPASTDSGSGGKDSGGKDSSPGGKDSSPGGKDSGGKDSSSGGKTDKLAAATPAKASPAPPSGGSSTSSG